MKPRGKVPESVAEFLSGRRVAVAGVSRDPGQAANAVYRKLGEAGYEVFAINPNATAIAGAPCYPDLASVPGPLDGVVIVTRPDVSVEIVRQSAARGVPRVWLHRSFGDGSVCEAAVRECEAAGIRCIVGGCPLMYCEPIDFGHRCMRWLLRWQRRVPG